MQYLSIVLSVSSDISHISSPACHWRQIGTVVKKRNLRTCHHAVDLWVDWRSTIRSVTAQEANSCSGHKLFDAVAFAVWLLKSYFLMQNEFYFKIPLQDNFDSTVGFFFVFLCNFLQLYLGYFIVSLKYDPAGLYRNRWVAHSIP